MTIAVDSTTWAARADVAQASLDHFFAAAPPQLLDNVHPVGSPDDNATFNYWWLAHVIDARTDAWERTGDDRWRAAAVQAFDNIVERNGGGLFNDYFDDMLWLALASLRLGQLGAGERFTDAARRIWDHVVEEGWNDIHGESLAWRKQQLYYKNTPANAPLVILSLRLHRLTGEERYLSIAERAYDWLTSTLVHPDTGFVEDGINREEDGGVDVHWRFTYNQGLYVGAGVEFFLTTAEPAYLDSARRTAQTAIDSLSRSGVFVDEGEGGDEGLFKGVYFRYLGLLLRHLDAPEREPFEAFLFGAVEQLWNHGFDGEWLLAGNDWSRPAQPPVHYSTQLSAIMAIELAAAVDAGRI